MTDWTLSSDVKHLCGIVSSEHGSKLVSVYRDCYDKLLQYRISKTFVIVGHLLSLCVYLS